MKLATGVALMCLLPGRCPSCGEALYEQLPLPGQQGTTSLVWCRGCGWWIATGQETVSPRELACR